MEHWPLPSAAGAGVSSLRRRMQRTPEPEDAELQSRLLVPSVPFSCHAPLLIGPSRQLEVLHCMLMGAVPAVPPPDYLTACSSLVLAHMMVVLVASHVKLPGDGNTPCAACNCGLRAWSSGQKLA